MKKLTLLALSAMFSFAGLAQAEECASKCKTACATEMKCSTEKCDTKCSTKEACAEKCDTACSLPVSTKEVCDAKCSTEKECATKCAGKCEKTCATKCAEKKECATKCATHCDKAVKVAHFNVAGMKCNACSTKLTKSLGALEGVTVKKVCHKTGCVDLALNGKTSVCKIKQTIAATGLKVVEPKK